MSDWQAASLEQQVRTLEGALAQEHMHYMEAVAEGRRYREALAVANHKLNRIARILGEDEVRHEDD